MDQKKQQVLAAGFTGGVGLIGGIDLIRHIPFGYESRVWSAWLILIWMCLMATIFGIGTFFDTIAPGWEKDPFDEDL